MRCAHIIMCVPYNIRIILFRHAARNTSIYRIMIGPTSGNFLLARPRLLYARSLHLWHLKLAAKLLYAYTREKV